VVAVLWQNGNKSWFAARIGARLVSAYVEKQRRLANNLQPQKAAAPRPVEVGALWTTPNPNSKADQAGEPETKMHTGKFYVGENGKVTGATEMTAAAKKAGASGPAKGQNASAAKASVSSAKLGQIANPKPGEPGSQSARLGGMPVLPAKRTTVKPQ
jgi:hypothetical protein